MFPSAPNGDIPLSPYLLIPFKTMNGLTALDLPIWKIFAARNESYGLQCRGRGESRLAISATFAFQFLEQQRRTGLAVIRGTDTDELLVLISCFFAFRGFLPHFSRQNRCLTVAIRRDR